MYFFSQMSLNIHLLHWIFCYVMLNLVTNRQLDHCTLYLFTIKTLKNVGCIFLLAILSKRTSHQNVLLWKVKMCSCQEVETYSCYKSKRTSMFPYNIKVWLDIIHKTSFIRYVYKLYNINTLMSYNK